MGTKISRVLIEFQSDRIEAVLASHKIPVRVHGGIISPAWVRFHFSTAPAARLSRIRGLSEEIALALGAADVRISREGDQLAIEVPRVDRQTVRLLPLLRQVSARARLDPVTACLGLAQDGRPLLLRLPSPDVCHVLVAGATGSGKTELIRSLLFSLAAANRQHKLQFALIDPKGRGLEPLSFLPHLLAPVATRPESALWLLERLTAEMDRRDSAGQNSPRVVVVVDELADLLMVGGPPVEQALTRLAQRGREAGLHLILGAQKPSSAMLGPQLKANLPVRLVGRVGSVEDARVATGVSSSGAERLTGQGDFLAVCAGDVIRFQAAYTGSDDLAELQAAVATRRSLLAGPDESGG